MNNAANGLIRMTSGSAARISSSEPEERDRDPAAQEHEHQDAAPDAKGARQVGIGVVLLRGALGPPCALPLHRQSIHARSPGHRGDRGCDVSVTEETLGLPVRDDLTDCRA